MTDQGDLEGEDVRDFMRQSATLMRRMLDELDADTSGGAHLLPLLTEHLGVPADGLGVVTETLPAHRAVDADIALSALAEEDPGAQLIGIGGGDARHHMTLSDLLHDGYRRRGFPVGQVEYARLDTGPNAEDTRDIVTTGIRLFHFGGTPVAVRAWGANRQFGREEGAFEILSPDPDVSRALIDRIQALMDERSVIRGQVVTLAGDPFGHGFAGLTFLPRPSVAADDVILPAGTLERVTGHVLGIGTHREALLRHGQHLKRGVLLFGPPGTGKTHTVRHLVSQSPGTTVVLLAGGALAHIHVAAKIARAHQPSIVVLEDCDLVAEDRGMSFGPTPLLFEVLDALDGLDADADIAFLLTTNRIEALESALAQRPGRVDLAAEIPLPDEAGRLALLRLYAGDHFSGDALAEAAGRTEGTTASFTKELVRRAVLRATMADESVGDGHLQAAIDELLADSESMTRSLLGVGGASAAMDQGFEVHGVEPGAFGWGPDDPHLG